MDHRQTGHDHPRGGSTRICSVCCSSISVGMIPWRTDHSQQKLSQSLSISATDPINKNKNKNTSRPGLSRAFSFLGTPPTVRSFPLNLSLSPSSHRKASFCLTPHHLCLCHYYSSVTTQEPLLIFWWDLSFWLPKFLYHAQPWWERFSCSNITPPEPAKRVKISKEAKSS